MVCDAPTKNNIMRVISKIECTSSAENVNEAGKQLFAQKRSSIKVIPLTLHALIQHINRAVCRTGFCWQQSLKNMQHLPSPSERSWTLKDDA